jgi:hypothetical protein
MVMNSWDKADEAVREQDKRSSSWLKFTADGESAVVVFLGDPFTQERSFVEGAKPSLRVSLNVAIFETREVKVFEFGAKVFKSIKEVREKYGLEKWAFEVKRHGAKGDQKTTYSILPEKQLSPEQQTEFQRLALNDLEAMYGAKTQGAAPAQQPLPTQQRPAQPGDNTQAGKLGAHTRMKALGWNTDQEVSFVQAIASKRGKAISAFGGDDWLAVHIALDERERNEKVPF